MVEHAITRTGAKASRGSIYDRFAGLYNFTFRFNGYSRSLEAYLRTHPLPISPGARILDAGCGTGLLTLTLLKTLEVPASIVAVDLSGYSISKAKLALKEKFASIGSVHFSQANVLALPFADQSFDLVVTSGVLEYVSLEDGLGELARVLARGGHMLHLPMRPSLMSKFLEIVFKFKTHPPKEVAKNTRQHFRVITHYRFPPLHPIGWSKTAVLAQKM
jgi:ubiquinone/menaquinone biosynthesis C-methylase UbiE